MEGSAAFDDFLLDPQLELPLRELANHDVVRAALQTIFDDSELGPQHPPQPSVLPAAQFEPSYGWYRLQEPPQPQQGVVEILPQYHLNFDPHSQATTWAGSQAQSSQAVVRTLTPGTVGQVVPVVASVAVAAAAETAGGEEEDVEDKDAQPMSPSTRDLPLEVLLSMREKIVSESKSVLDKLEEEYNVRREDSSKGFMDQLRKLDKEIYKVSIELSVRVRCPTLYGKS